MSRPSEAVVLMDLPEGPGRSALRAALMALRVVPADLPPEPKARASALRGLADPQRGMAFIDISNDGPSPSSKLLALDAQLPRDGQRQHIVLTRLHAGAGMGHVSDADRRWVKQLGFADLLPEFDAADCEGHLRTAIDGVATRFGLAPLSPADLARYARVMNTDRDNTSPRALIRAWCGLSAESLCDLLQTSLDIADRSYRLRPYPQCFVGSEAVAWLARHFKRSRTEAVALGQALMALGLLVHVAHEHPFLDDHLYYRLAASPAADAVELGVAWARLTGPDGPPIDNRLHLGKTYEQCWVGAEAVDRLVGWHGLQRHDAWIVLHRLMQFGLIEHVVRARPIIDGAFFYRFSGVPAAGVR